MPYTIRSKSYEDIHILDQLQESDPYSVEHPDTIFARSDCEIEKKIQETNLVSLTSFNYKKNKGIESTQSFSESFSQMPSEIKWMALSFLEEDFQYFIASLSSDHLLKSHILKDLKIPEEWRESAVELMHKIIHQKKQKINIKDIFLLLRAKYMQENGMEDTSFNELSGVIQRNIKISIQIDWSKFFKDPKNIFLYIASHTKQREYHSLTEEQKRKIEPIYDNLITFLTSILKNQFALSRARRSKENSLVKEGNIFLEPSKISLRKFFSRVEHFGSEDEEQFFIGLLIGFATYKVTIPKIVFLGKKMFQLIGKKLISKNQGSPISLLE